MVGVAPSPGPHMDSHLSLMRQWCGKFFKEGCVIVKGW